MEALITLFDFSSFLAEANFLLHTNPVKLLWFLFSSGGWVLFAVPLPFIAHYAYMNFIQAKWHATVKYYLLAVDIPQENEQSTRAVEHLFYQIWSVYNPPNLIGKYLKGEFQLAVSFEIVSIDGYVQFLIRVPENSRDHVEAAIYAQYPNAEVKEVEDYTESVPSRFPNDKYQMFGTEFVQAKNPAYPIKTYPLFEDSTELRFADPMSAILEALSKIQKGEQVWIQLVATPLSHDWASDYQSAVQKLMGAKMASKGPGALRTQLGALGSEMFGQLGGGTPGAAPSAGPSEPPNQMLYLSPGDRTSLELMQIKLSKPGFAVKFRAIYIAEKEKYNPARGISSVFGGINQFNSLSLNMFKLGGAMTTYVDYFFVKRRTDRRRRLLMEQYKARSQSEGQGNGVILNTEELATLYHFPITTVVAPGLKRKESKRAGPPVELPEEALSGVLAPEDEDDGLPLSGSSGSPGLAPPDNLPF